MRSPASWNLKKSTHFPVLCISFPPSVRKTPSPPHTVLLKPAGKTSRGQMHYNKEKDLILKCR